MEELKTYLEWEEIICAERNVIVYDPDAYRMICDLGKQNELMTREEAESYFSYNTLMTYDFE